MMAVSFLETSLTILVLLSGISGHNDDDASITQLEEESANYLHNVMNQIQHDKEEDQSIEIMELTNIVNMDRVSEPQPDSSTLMPSRVPSGSIFGPTPLPPLQAEIHPLSPPPPTLTAEELNAIYKAALIKGASLSQLQQGPFTLNSAGNNPVVQPSSQGVADSLPGYYYYYYPIKSFKPEGDEKEQNSETPKPAMMEPEKAPMNKAVEPLFMAVTGFVGMAMMFIVSVLFLPKFNQIRIHTGPESKEDPHELAVLGKLLFESLDGKDCTERLACEMGQFVRSIRMGKAIKIMEIILPPNAARQVSMIRKAMVKKERCNFIPCRFKTNRPPAKTVNERPWKKGTTPHEQWMKHFEKAAKKKHANVWNKKS